MKINGIAKHIKYSKILTGILLASLSYDVSANAMNCVPLNVPGEIYFGVFGGIAESSKLKISQYGTAFYIEALGGPLAVNAFGTANDRSTSVFGAHLGYRFAEIFPAPCSSWAIAPAVEWEGFYLRKDSFKAHDVSNDTERLDEHDFFVTYPTRTGVFLANAVLNLNFACYSRLHPYIGAGIGAAVISITDANAAQVSPPEPGINHFNSNPSDRDTTLAVQTKIGVSFDICKKLSAFAEYRWLYLSDSHFVFGSTVFPGHPETSPWFVNFDNQHYNMGTIGVQYSI